MKRFTQVALAYAIVLALVSVAVAQEAPTPVIRIGDWVEVGNEVFMNIIGTADIRYNTTHNLDFEGDIQDRSADREFSSTTQTDQEGDYMRVEARFGVDFRYQKNLRLRVLFEHQSVMDGNIIDDRSDARTAPETDPFGRQQPIESEPTNLERFWIEYKFPQTPLRLRVGSDLWFSDQAGLLGDDDPRFALYLDLGPREEFELGAWAVIQNEAQRIGLQNDNDNVYYVFHAAYEGIPGHTFGVDVAYFRWRFNALSDPGTGEGGVPQIRRPQHHDTVLIMPSWSGTVGPLTALLQFNVLLGTADGQSADGTSTTDYDVFAWGAVAYAEADLGIITPFVGVFFGSGDDDPDDTDLNGFMTLPQREITLIAATPWFGFLEPTMALGTRDVVTPARASGPFGGQEFSHTTGNPFNDRIGNGLHADINSTYSNPGTLAIPVGVQIAPLPGHRVDLFYVYRGMIESELIEADLGRNVSNTLYHEFMAVWTWTLNRHFDIRLAGNVAVPGAGAQDIAETVDCEPGIVGLQRCDGEDLALQGEARFRARF